MLLFFPRECVRNKRILCLCEQRDISQPDVSELDFSQLDVSQLDASPPDVSQLDVATQANSVSSRFTGMKISMFHKASVDDFPALKGRAAEMRHFPAALSYAFSQFMDATDHVQQQIKNGLDLSVEMESKW